MFAFSTWLAWRAGHSYAHSRMFEAVRLMQEILIPLPLDSARNVRIGNDLPLTFIAGPCVLESRAHALEVASELKQHAAKANVGLIFKSSYDKANRTARGSYRGVGLQQGLSILAEIREKLNLPVLTDIHEVSQAALVAEVADIIQIPAFLCRQTDLIEAAAATMKPVNIKKGQFLAPEDMFPVLSKATAKGNDQVCLCERGTFFGYHDLVVDMRALAIMKQSRHPVIFDATHSVQAPAAKGECSGGRREFVVPLARAAVATGIAAVFMEAHPDPDHAPCDGPNMLNLSDVPAVIKILQAIDRLVKQE